MQHGLEMELKFSIDPVYAGEAIRIAESLLHFRNQKVRHHEHAIYFDTTEFSLRQLGCSLRVRSGPNGWEQVVKASAPQTGIGAGPLVRREWRWSIAAPAVARDSLEECMREILRTKESLPWLQDLDQQFETELDRTTLLLAPETGVLVEMSLDRGKVYSAFARTTICEIELELKAGDEFALVRTGQRFCGELTLVPHTRTKADIGYADLLRHRSAAAVGFAAPDRV